MNFHSFIEKNYEFMMASNPLSRLKFISKFSKKPYMLRFQSHLIPLLSIIFSLSLLLTTPLILLTASTNAVGQKCIEQIPEEIKSYLFKKECVVEVESKSYASGLIRLTIYKLSSGRIIIYSDDFKKVVLGREWVKMNHAEDLALELISLLAYDEFKPLKDVNPQDYLDLQNYWAKSTDIGMDYAKKELAEIAIIHLGAGLITVMICPGVGALFLVGYALDLAKDLMHFTDKFKVNEKNSPRLFKALALMPSDESEMAQFYDALNRLADKEFINKVKELSEKTALVLRGLKRGEAASRYFLLFAYIHAAKSEKLINLVESIVGRTKFNEVGGFLLFRGDVNKFKDFRELVSKVWSKEVHPSELDKFLRDYAVKSLKDVGAGLMIGLVRGYVIHLGEEKREFLGFHTSHSLLIRELSYDLRNYVEDLKDGKIPPTLDNIMRFWYYDYLLRTIMLEYDEGVLDLTTATLYEIGDAYPEIIKHWGFEAPPPRQVSGTETWAANIYGLFSFLKELQQEHVKSTLRNMLAYAVNVTNFYREIAEDMARRRGKDWQPTFRSLDVFLVMDTSGSMGSEFRGKTKLDAAKDSAKDFISILSPRDRIGIVKFSTTASLLMDLTSNKAEAERIIESLTPGGNTSMGDGLYLALDKLETTDPKRLKVILLLTDGMHNAGTHTPMEAAVRAKKLQIPIYTIGYGESGDIDEDTLKAVASITNAAYSYAPSPIELRRLYLSLSKLVTGYTVAKSVVDLVKTGETKDINVTVQANTSYITSILTYSGSKLSLAVIDPDGIEISKNASNIIFNETGQSITITIYNPSNGTWILRVKGVETPPEGTEYRLLMIMPPIIPERRTIILRGVPGVASVEILNLTTLRKITALDISLIGEVVGILSVSPHHFENVSEGHRLQVKIKADIPASANKTVYTGFLRIVSMGSITDIPIKLFVMNSIIPQVSTNKYILREGESLLIQVRLFDPEGADVTNGEVSAEINGISLKLNETSPNLYRGEITLTDIRPGEYLLKIIAQKEDYRSSRLEIPIRIIIMGDINYDNVVDYKDLAILGRTYGVTSMDPHFEGRADLNNDCIIDYKDLAILAANYGRRAS